MLFLRLRNCFEEYPRSFQAYSLLARVLDLGTRRGELALIEFRGKRTRESCTSVAITTNVDTMTIVDGDNEADVSESRGYHMQSEEEHVTSLCHDKTNRAEIFSVKV